MKISDLNFFRKNKIHVHEIDNKSRDKNILKQISSSILLKVASFGISLFLVPILLGKLGLERYGVWAILISLMQWIALMDIGIGNGLRNRLTISLAQNKLIDAKEYVSTAYFTMIGLGVLLLIVLFPFLFFVEWSSFFNSKNISNAELRKTVFVFTFSIIIYFVLSLINQVVNAIQRSALNSIIPLLSSAIFLGSLIFFFPINGVSLFSTTLIYSLSLVFVNLVFSIFFFTEYSFLRPNFSFFRKVKIKSIMNLGIKFFIIQITVVIIYSTDNIIITQMLGPKFVTVYSIPYIIFNNIAMLVSLITMPLFSSYTEAYIKNDYEWIRKKILLLTKLMIPFVLGVLLVIYLFSDLLKLWLKTSIDVPKSLPVIMGFYSILIVWNSIFSTVLGAISKINLGMYITVFQGILNIPLSIFLASNLGMGLNGIVLSNIICLGISALISPIQVYYFIFSNKLNKKWEKYLS